MLVLAGGILQEFNERIVSNIFEIRKETFENDSLRSVSLGQPTRSFVRETTHSSAE